MLTIRSEQFAVFQPVAEHSFARRVAAHLRAQHGAIAVQLPDGVVTLAQLPNEKILSMVKSGIERARRYGLQWESSITAFVVVMFVAAPNFDEHPLIQRILRDDKLSPDLRIDHLWQHTSEQNWQAIKQRYDANAWQGSQQEKQS